MILLRVRSSEHSVANRIALTMIFTLSFASYIVPDLSLLLQIAPLVLFMLLVVFKVLLSSSLLDAMESLFAPDGLAFVLLLSLCLIASSVQSSESLAFSLLLCSCLLLARLYMAVVPLSEVLEAFFWSGVICIAFFVPMSLATLIEAVRSLSRFTAFNFHPNLLAFVLAGFFCTMAWKTLTGGRVVRLIAFPLGVICLVIIFLASSRGSIAGILVGGVVAVVLSTVRLVKEEDSKSLRRLLIFAALAITALIVVHAEGWSQDTYDVADQVLQVTDSNRGIDSGLSGRFDKWQETMNTMRDGSWLWGHGIRTSDSMSQLIDNSYLVTLYEVGILPLLLISFRFFSLVLRSVKKYFSATDPTQAATHLVCILLMTVFLSNNFVARYLFAVGNPYSFFALLVFVAPTTTLSASARSESRHRTHRASATKSPRTDDLKGPA
jgi:O-antigen ligase